MTTSRTQLYKSTRYLILWVCSLYHCLKAHISLCGKSLLSSKLHYRLFMKAIFLHLVGELPERYFYAVAQGINCEISFWVLCYSYVFQSCLFDFIYRVKFDFTCNALISHQFFYYHVLTFVLCCVATLFTLRWSSELLNYQPQNTKI